MLAAQLLQQVQHLRLHRHVERARRFVEHEQLRPGGEGAGDADTLALPAGELVGRRSAWARARPNSSRSSRARAKGASAQRGVRAQRFRDRLLDRKSRSNAATGFWKTMPVLARGGAAPGCGAL